MTLFVKVFSHSLDEPGPRARASFSPKPIFSAKMKITVNKIIMLLVITLPKDAKILATSAINALGSKLFFHCSALIAIPLSLSICCTPALIAASLFEYSGKSCWKLTIADPITAPSNRPTDNMSNTTVKIDKPVGTPRDLSQETRGDTTMAINTASMKGTINAFAIFRPATMTVKAAKFIRNLEMGDTLWVIKLLQYYVTLLVLSCHSESLAIYVQANAKKQTILA